MPDFFSFDNLRINVLRAGYLATFLLAAAIGQPLN